MPPINQSINQSWGGTCKKLHLRLAPSPLLLALDEGEERDEATAAVGESCFTTTLELCLFATLYHIVLPFGTILTAAATCCGTWGEVGVDRHVAGHVPHLHRHYDHLAKALKMTMMRFRTRKRATRSSTPTLPRILLTCIEVGNLSAV